MEQSGAEEMAAVVARKAGVPGWWSDVFLSLGLKVREAEAFLETASADPSSPLNRGVEARLLEELKDFAVARGFDVSGALGEGVPKKVDKRSSRFVSRLRLVCTPEEQSKIEQEVMGFAEVRFGMSVSGVYTGHAVAHGVTQVVRSYLFRLSPRGARVLEVGASLSTVVYAARDPAVYHASIPLLDVSSAARASVAKQVACVLRNKGGLFSEAQRATARLVQDTPEVLVTKARVQDITRVADVIISNMANFDIPMDDMPVIMERCSTRMWLGSLVRVKGISRMSTRVRGEVPVLGFRYEVDPANDAIRFNSNGGSEFGYRHSFAGYAKYEERNDYRWLGARYDYVYMRLPATTASTLLFCVFRVPKVGFPTYVEPRFFPTGKEKMVCIKSFRMVREASGPTRVEPVEFDLERLLYDKAYERRRAYGVKGNVADTLSILRTLRVRVFLNGTPVGVEQRLHYELLDATAMAVELLVGQGRRMEERDYGELRVCAATRLGIMDRVVDAVFGGLATRVSDVREGCLDAMRDFVATMGVAPLVTVRPYSEYMRLDDVVPSGGASAAAPQLGEGLCVARERADLAAALAHAALYTSEELVAVRAYLASLAGVECMCGACESEGDFLARVAPELPEEEVWFDAESVVGTGSEAGGESDDSGSAFDGCSIDEEFSPVDTGPEAACIEEYVGVTRYQVRAVRSEARKSARMLFRGGLGPSERELERASGTRLQHFAMTVADGRLVKAVGSGASLAVREVYSPGLDEFFRVDREAKVLRARDGVYYSSTEFLVFNGEELARAAECLWLEQAAVTEFAKFDFVNGVPGAGKTRVLRGEMLEALADLDLPEVVYVSATKGSASAVRQRVYGDDVRGKEVVRTADSFLRWGLRARAGDARPVRLVVDEAPMLHAGQVMACVLRAGLSVAALYGDFHQIPYCSFVAERLFPVLRSSLVPFSRVTHMSRSHRLAVDACAAWVDVYDGRLFSCSCCHLDRGASTMSVRQVATLADIVYEPGVRYLVFTQAERVTLLCHLGFAADVQVVRAMDEGGLATVHEDQGATHARVCLVRLVPRWDVKASALAPSLYNRQAYVLSAMTRHVDSFVYVTLSAEVDLVRRRVAASVCPMRRAVVQETVSWESVKTRVMRV